jgi:hypothetical protein
MDNIKYNEDYKIFDSLLSNPNPFAKGWVRMFIHKNPDYLGAPVVEGNNLIVANGREFTAQKIFNLPSTANDWTNYNISGFGIGQGGATINGGVPVINDPTLDDIGLNNPIFLNSSFNTENSSTTEGVIKPITTDGSIELLDGEYSTTPYYSKVKCSCVIDSGEPTNLGVGESIQISEAGLYFINSSGTNKLFSHICFAPKWKEVDSMITIEWYIIC